MRALRAPKGLNGHGQSQLGSHTHPPLVRDLGAPANSGQAWSCAGSPGRTLDPCLSPGQTLGQVHPTLVLSPSAPGWGPNTAPGPGSPLALSRALMNLHSLGTLESCFPRQFNLFRTESW